jgi:hypothetical protein
VLSTTFETPNAISGRGGWLLREMGVL